MSEMTSRCLHRANRQGSLGRDFLFEHNVPFKTLLYRQNLLASQQQLETQTRRRKKSTEESVEQPQRRHMKRETIGCCDKQRDAKRTLKKKKANENTRKEIGQNSSWDPHMPNSWRHEAMPLVDTQGIELNWIEYNIIVHPKNEFCFRFSFDFYSVCV